RAARRCRGRARGVGVEVQAPRRAGDAGAREAGSLSRLTRAGAVLGGGAGAAMGWGWFEAGWVRLRTLELALPRLPEELAGLRIAHLSDLHLGLPSRGQRAVERAVDWVASRAPDLIVITGDLVSRPAGEVTLRRLLSRLGPALAVLGNHDVEHTR